MWGQGLSFDELGQGDGGEDGDDNGGDCGDDGGDGADGDSDGGDGDSDCSGVVDRDGPSGQVAWNSGS